MAGTGKIVALIKALAPGVDPSVIEQAVTDWLDDHPEATTTVEDGSITEEKLASDVLADLAEIEELKEAIGNVPSGSTVEGQISDLKSAFESLFRTVGSVNLQNWENGKGISSTNGSIVSSPLRACTTGHALQFPNKRIRFKVKDGYQCGCAEYTVISGIGGFVMLWNVINTPKTGEFEFDFDPKKYYRFAVTKSDGTAMESVPVDVITYSYVYLFDNATVVVHSGDNLLEKLMYAESLKPNAKKVFVEAGDYDIISDYEDHFGSSYFTNYANNYNGRANGLWDTGLWLQDIEVYFSPGANVTANYEGNNSYVKQYFSAFSCGENVVIDGLVLDCSNVRYGIHADFWYNGEPCELAIRNCDLHCYTASDTSVNNNSAIGAGLPLHGNWVIENCIIRSDTSNRVIRIHNNVNEGAKSYVVIKDCIIVGNGHIEVNKYGASTEKTIAIVTGCNWNNPAVSIFDSPSSTKENIDFYSFDNTLRSDPLRKMYHSYNWCDPAEITKHNGKYMRADGTTGTGSDYAYTGMIPVNPGDIVYILKNSMIKTGAGYRFVTAFDESKAVVSASGESTAGMTYTVPEGIKYVVVTIFLAGYNAADFSINVGAMMPFDTYIEESLPNGYKQASESEMFIKKMPLTGMPVYIRNAMAYRPLQSPSKGYMCLVSDDGKEGLATYTCPMVIEKEVPCTFAVMSESEVFADDTLKATVLDAVNNHGCAIAQHGGRNWTEYSEYGLNQFFDEEKAFFDSLGVSVKSAVIPSHYTTPLVQIVAGGRFGVVRSGLKGYDADGNYGHTVHNYYDFYTSGEGSNLYGLSSYNLSGYSLATNKFAIDYAYANKKILIVYWHENALDAEKKAVMEGAIDYAKAKGMEFITLDKIPYLTEVLSQF